MNYCLSALLLLTAALPTMAAGDTKNTSLDRPENAPSHVLYDQAEIQKLQRFLKQAAVPSGNGINFHGGPVMTNTVTIYYIWYGNWNGNNGVSLLESFAKNLGGSPYFNINTSYTDGSGAPVKNTLIFGGSIVDNYSMGTAMSDAQIWQVVANAITNGKLPSDPNGVYFVLTSKDVNATSGFCSQYCGWHWYNVLSGVSIKYSFVGDSGRCPGGCTAQASNSPNGNVGADGMASVIAHELSETVSDPQGTGWWDNSSGDENGDKCAWTFGVTSAASNGSRYNLTLAGTNYLIQQMWLNAAGGTCVMSYVPPTVNGISPASGDLGGAVPVTITGSNFVSGANLAISGVGVTTSKLAVVSPTQITATLNIAGNADVGVHNVSVTQGAAVGGPVTFTVNAPSFTISQVAPATGGVGATVPVTVTGAGFASGATLTLSGTGITTTNVKVVSATQITASLAIAASAAPGDYKLTVMQSGAAAVPVTFTVTAPAMTLTGITPNTLPLGGSAKITLAGTNFPAGANVNVSGSGVSVTGVTVVSATQITANVAAASTATAGARSVTVSYGANTSPAATLTIAAPASLSSVTPAAGQAGNTVPITLNGSNFAVGANVAISGTGITVSGLTVVSATKMTANLVIGANAAPGARTISLGGSSNTTSGIPFTVTAMPTVAGVTPSAGAPGSSTKITLTGANFVDGSTVAVSGSGITVNNVTVLSSTQITANVAIDPAASTGARNLTVTSTGLTSAPAIFTVAVVTPALTALSPSTTAAGTTATVTLAGTGFTSASVISISGSGVTVSNATVVSATQMTAQFVVSGTASLGARTVKVSNGNAASGTQAFTVTAAIPPTLAKLDKSTGAAGSTLSVTATGSNFAAGNTLSFSGTGITVSNLVVVSPTQMTATLSIAPTAAVGPRTVAVGSSNSTTRAVAAVTFTVTAAIPAPVLTQLDKTTGVAGSTVNVTATGTNFAAGNTLNFSGAGITVSNLVVVSPTQMTATLTIASTAAAGPRTAVVAGANSTAVASAGVTFTVTAPVAGGSVTVSSMAPNSGTLGAVLSATLTGTGFTANTTVSTGDPNIPVLQTIYVSATQLKVFLGLGGTVGNHALVVTVPASATTKSVTSSPVAFTIAMPAPPTTTGITPATGAVGTNVTVTINGTNFTPDMIVQISGADVKVGQMTQAGPTFVAVPLTIPANASPGTRSLSIKTPGGTSNTVTFTVTK